MEQFTASEVRDWERAYKGTGAAKVFGAFADLLEAQEKAVPVGEVVGVAGSYGEMRMIRWRDRYSPAVGTKLYTRSAPAQPPAASVTVDAVMRVIDEQRRLPYRSIDEKQAFRNALDAALAAQENPNG